MKSTTRLIAMAVVFWAALSIDAAAAQTPLKSEPAFDKEHRPIFSDRERQVIHDYYKRILGTIAPGTLQRYDPYPLAVQKSLTPGSRLPMQLEKELQLLPKDLEEQLSMLTGEYKRYKLGRHVVLVQQRTMIITDIIKKAGWEKD